MFTMLVHRLGTHVWLGITCECIPGDKTVAQHMEELQERIKGVKDLLQGIRDAIVLGSDMALQGEFNITQAEGIIQRAREALRVSFMVVPQDAKMINQQFVFIANHCVYHLYLRTLS